MADLRRSAWEMRSARLPIGMRAVVVLKDIYGWSHDDVVAGPWDLRDRRQGAAASGTPPAQPDARRTATRDGPHSSRSAVRWRQRPFPAPPLPRSTRRLSRLPGLRGARPTAAATAGTPPPRADPRPGRTGHAGAGSDGGRPGGASDPADPSSPGLLSWRRRRRPQPWWRRAVGVSPLPDEAAGHGFTLSPAHPVYFAQAGSPPCPRTFEPRGHRRGVARIGRAPVSKTGGCGFESRRPCSARKRYRSR